MMPQLPTLKTTRQISSYLAKYDPTMCALANEARRWMRQRLPAASELVYDNYNALVFGYGPGDRASEAIFSLALYPRWLRLFFLHGATLHDPLGLLEGAGKQVRSIVVHAVSDLDKPEVRALITEAIERAAPTWPAGGVGETIIKSVSAKRRPRR